MNSLLKKNNGVLQAETKSSHTFFLLVVYASQTTILEAPQHRTLQPPYYFHYRNNIYFPEPELAVGNIGVLSRTHQLKVQDRTQNPCEPIFYHLTIAPLPESNLV